MQYLLFEDPSALDLLPLTYTRPVHELRIGIDTIQEKWQRHFPHPIGSFVLRPALQGRYADYNPYEDTLFLNAKYLPEKDLIDLVTTPFDPKEALISPAYDLIAFRSRPQDVLDRIEEVVHWRDLWMIRTHEVVPQANQWLSVRYPWDLFRLNGAALRRDFAELTAEQTFRAIDDPHTVTYNEGMIYVEEGARVKGAYLNAEEGPIYIGRNAEVQEGAVLRGAHAIGEHASVSPGAKLRGDTTIGPHCKVGGEVTNSILQGFSNKAHEGYMGNSFVGEWCNLGAGTTVSNLKNNYSTVRVFNYRKHQPIDTNQQFCGLIMGDHCKTAIGTLLNTGTVAGVSANIFGTGFPPKLIPSFAWGNGKPAFETFELEAALQVAERMMARRGQAFRKGDRRILEAAFYADRGLRQS